MPARPTARPLYWVPLILALAATGCGDDGTSPLPEVITPGALETLPLTGAARVGATVSPPPVVVLRDTEGRPLAGATVSFDVTAGGGSIERAASATAVDGSASPGAWVLGIRPGTNTLEVRSAGVAPVSVSVTAVVGPPATLTASEATAAPGVVGMPLDPAPAVVVQDAFGNPVAGVAVAFAPGSGSGEVAQPSALTDASGVARVVWTLGGKAGMQTLLAVSGSLSDTLTAEAATGPPTGLQMLAGDSQSATVGQPVAVPPAVQVRDAFGNPVGGASVQFTVTEGDGQVTGGSTVSDSSGSARVGSWILDTRAGSNQLTASTAGAQPAVFSALGTPGAPAALVRLAGDGQTGTIGEPLTVAPAVSLSDTYGNPVPDIQVTFVTASGTVTGAATLSDAAGVARVGSWRLGLTAGPQTLDASTDTLTVTFTALATPGAPAALEIVAGQGQAATAGLPVPVRPAVRVRDVGGNPVAGAAIRFAVAVGGGTVNGDSAVSASDGIATVGDWTLGPRMGVNRLSATSSGVTALFRATGLAGPPARLLKAAGDGQIVLTGSAVPIRPTVRVTDVNANPVAGITVVYSASAGSSIAGAVQTTGSSGTASVDEWVLAATPGINSLDASVPGVDGVTFTAIGSDDVPPPTPFHIELRYLTPVTPVQRQAFESAVTRWEGIITADVPDYSLQLPPGACGDDSPPIDEVIDDLVILVQLESIDGPGSLLGSAGPCYLRDDDKLPLLGRMRFDTSDLDALELSGRLGDVVLHEMGHVLGIGTLWTTLGELQGADTADPIFTGTGARQQFVLAGGTTPFGVPVENTGGAGTRNLHWRETVFQTELMTGWISPAGTANPLSAITIASLADLGYVVDVGRADPFIINNVPGYALEAPPGMELIEEPLPPPRIAR